MGDNIGPPWVNSGSKNGKFIASIREAGFELIHDYRKGKRGGGTAILYRKELNVKPGEASSSKYISFQYSYITVKVNNSKMLVVCIYHKQELSCSLFCDENEKFLESIFTREA